MVVKKTMIKNNSYDITICSSRNEVIDAVKSKKMYIELSGDIHKEIMEELKKQIQDTKKGHMIGETGFTVGSIIAAVTIFTSLPGFLLGVSVATISRVFQKNTFFSDYRIALFSIRGEDKIAFISNGFNNSLDTINGYENYVFLKEETSKCPNCKCRWGEEHKRHNPTKCPDCKKEFIITYDERKCKKAEKKS